jgi:uncharacterized protein YndB with AHSA1/START domain
MGHVSYSEYIKATPEQVWTIISDAARLPDWAYTEGRFPYTVEGKYGSDQKEGSGTVWIGVSEDGQTATQQITVWEPTKKLVYELQEMENAPLQMAQTNTFELERENGHTKVTWIVDWELTGGFSLSGLFLRFTGNGAFEEMIAGSLGNLKQLVEKESLAEPAAAETSAPDTQADEAE